MISIFGYMKTEKDNKTITIKNFRVFNQKGASIDLKPITIITGCNSSGKSSIVKALVCLNSALNHIKSSDDLFGPSKVYLDFNHYPGSLLGSFDKSIRNHSKSKTLIFEFEIYSHFLNETVIVSINFQRAFGNNGVLEDYTILLKKDGSIIASSRFYSFYDDCYRNLRFLKQKFRIFLAALLLHDDRNLNDNDKKLLLSILGNNADSYIEDIRWMCYNNDRSIFIYNEDEKLALLKFLTNDILTYLPIIDCIKSSEIKTIAARLKHLTDSKEFRQIKSNAFKDSSQELNHFKEAFINNISSLLSISPNGFTEYYKELESNSLKYKFIHIDRSAVTTDDLWSESLVINNIQNRINDGWYRGEQIADLVYFDCLKRLLLTIPLLKKDRFYESYIESLNNYKVSHLFFAEFIELFLFNLFKTELTPCIKYIVGSNPIAKRGYSTNDNDSFSIVLNNYLQSREDVDIYLDIERQANEEYERLRHTSLPEVAFENGELVPVNQEQSEKHKQKSRLFKIAKNKKTSSYESFTLDKLNNLAKNHKFLPTSFINKWIRKFEIGDRIIIAKNEELQLVSLSIEKGKKLIQLADEGYGVTQLILLLLQIETIILQNPHKDYITTTLAIEEPEVHLHPKFQSLLADLIIDAYKTYNVHFIVETHSEYLIRKLQVLVAKKEANPSTISIVYVDTPDKKKRKGKQVRNITIRENGILSDSFGAGFFDESSRLAFELF